jgi:hypothetical protein
MVLSPRTAIISIIDLVLIDQQSVENRRLHLMGTINAKKEPTIYWGFNNFWKTSIKWPALHFKKLTTLITFLFWNVRLPSLLFYSVSGNANSMVSKDCYLWAPILLIQVLQSFILLNTNKAIDTPFITVTVSPLAIGNTLYLIVKLNKKCFQE